MATRIWDEYDGSSNTIVTATKGLRKKLNIILPQLMSKQNYFAWSNFIPRSTPIIVGELIPNEAGRSIPTEVELCLLFCSMFPEGFILPFEDMVMYGMALNLFEDVHNMSQARCRVNGLINIINQQLPPHYLNKLCLWEDKFGDRYVKILDGALDSARSIASKYQLAFCPEIVQSTWPNTDWEKYCYGFSCVLIRINEFFVNLECPTLALLQLQHREDSVSIPIDLFQGAKELRVLSLDVVWLSHPLNVLRNLRMLRLKLLKSKNMSCIGGLINLEFLSISTASLTDVPKEIRHLGNLRLLDLRNMKIAWFPPGVLSRMLKLEELYFPLSFRRWGCKAQDEQNDFDEWGSLKDDDYDERISGSVSEINDGERMNTSISEIVSHLLNTLQIAIPKSSILPKKSPIFKNLQRFKILVPTNLKYRPLGKYYSLNVLQLTGDARDIEESGICDLTSRTEDLNLTRVRNLRNFMFKLQQYGFPQLQKMIISECDELEYVVDTAEKQILPIDDYSFSKLESLHLSMLSNLKEIWHGRWTKLRWFANLSQISIRFCHRLKYVFPVSIFKGFTLLKSIKILDCNEMLGIFYQDEEDDSPFFPYFIEELDLHSLPKLVDFMVQKDDIVDGIHGDANQSLKTIEVLSNNVEGSFHTFDDDFQSFSTNESNTGLIESCTSDEELTCPASTSISEGKLQQCVTQQLVFNRQISRIKNSDAVSHMEMHSAYSSELAEKWCPTLKRLKIAFCDAVEIIFWFQENHVTSTAFDSLKEIELYGLRNLIHIWNVVPLETTAFQNLQLLVLSECRNLYLFSPRVGNLLVCLQKVYISRCEKMEEIMVKEDDDQVEGKIVFPQLKLLELQHLPNLRTIFNWIYPIELPSLESLKFNQCNEVKSFSYGSLWTPLLKSVEVNSSSYSILRDGLNATIERYMGNCSGTSSNDTSSTICTNSPISAGCAGHSNDDYSSSAINPNSPPRPRSSDTLYEPSPVDLPGTSWSDSSEANEANSNNQILRSGGSTISPNGAATHSNVSVISSSEGSSDNSYSTATAMYFSATSGGAMRNQLSAATSEANEDANPNGEILETPDYKKVFTFVDLKIATKSFSPDNLLGQGGFGNIYRGWLDEKTFAPSKTGTGMVVAIKKLSPNSNQGLREWRREVIFLERQSHPNLVKLLGHCREDNELLLVYEFIPRASLHDHLLRNNGALEPLSWDMRLKIAIGVAQGLSFLHTSRKKVVHRDVKPANILLDKDYNAKICDFGLARWGPSDQNWHWTTMNDNTNISDFWLGPSDVDLDKTTMIEGTPGYVDPSYFSTGRLTVKNDVYSFGVVLLQLMTGSSVIDRNRPEAHQNVLLWFKSVLSENRELKNVMDSRMEGQYSSKAMLRTSELALKCTDNNPRRRPSMRKVLKELQQIVALKEDDND